MSDEDVKWEPMYVQLVRLLKLVEDRRGVSMRFTLTLEGRRR